MKILKGIIQEDFSRDIYWVKIIILSDTDDRKSKILACLTQEYLDGLTNNNAEVETVLNFWLGEVIKKWQKIGDQIFDQDVHYDVYASNQNGEANGLDFLIKLE